MVDRIDKVDASLYRIQEPLDEGGGQKQEQQPQEDEKKKEKEKKDKFDVSGKTSLKQLFPDVPAQRSSGVMGRKLDLFPDTNPRLSERKIKPEDIKGETKREETSQTLRYRLLALWGVLDIQGKPRIPVIVSYVVAMAATIVSGFLILRILWR